MPLLIAEADEDQKAHLKKLIPVVLKLKKRLEGLYRLSRNPTHEQQKAAFADLAPELMSVSKCPDYIVNKGHYFGSNLSNDDKEALIEFLKTM